MKYLWKDYKRNFPIRMFTDMHKCFQQKATERSMKFYNVCSYVKSCAEGGGPMVKSSRCPQHSDTRIQSSVDHVHNEKLR